MALWGSEHLEARESPIEGTGLFVTKDFETGSLIYERDETRLVTPETPLDGDSGEFGWHCIWLAGKRLILLAKPECYINHSCDPNSYTDFIDGAGFKRAIRPIRAGEELTSDYCMNSVDDLVRRCQCGSPICRGLASSNFFRLPLPRQLQYLPLLGEWFVHEHDQELVNLRRLAPPIS